MFDKLRIKEHMEVTDAKGRHLGIVDEVENERIKLTKGDSADSMHHYIPLDQMDRVDDNRLYLKEGARIPEGLTGRTEMV